MGMTKQFEFSPEIVKEVNYQRYNHLVPLVQRRMDAIRFKAFGLLHKEIAELIGITEKTLNLRCRKVGMLPAKADPEKQKEFLEQEIQPRLDEAQAGKRVVFFVDAAHFVLAPFLGFLWSVVRVLSLAQKTLSAF